MGVNFVLSRLIQYCRQTREALQNPVATWGVCDRRELNKNVKRNITDEFRERGIELGREEMILSGKEV